MLTNGAGIKKYAAVAGMAAFLSWGNCAFADEHSGYIPADTPYYLGSGEDLPLDLLLAFIPTEDFPVPEDIDEKDKEILETVYGTFTKLDTILPEWGLGENLHFSSYAVGLYPVVRVKLDDAEKFNSAIAKLETERELTPSLIEREDYEVRFYSEDSFSALVESLEDDDKSEDKPAKADSDSGNNTKETTGESSGASDAAENLSTAGIVVATNKEDVIFTIVDDGSDAELLDRVLGISKPEKTMADSGKLAEFRKRWDYGDYAGFVDLMVVADILTSDDSLAAKDLAKFAGEDDPENRDRLDMMRSELCSAEIRSMAENLPMIVTGMRDFEINEKELSYVSHFAAEVGHEQFKSTLQLLRGVIPASQSASQAVFSLGLGLSVDNLTQFIGQISNLLREVNYQCPMLTGLNSVSSTDLSAASMGVVMFGGMARGVQGLGVSLFDVAFSADGGDIPIDGADMAVVVNAQDPQVLLQTLQMMPEMGVLAEMPLDGSEISLNSLLPIPLPDGVELKAAVKEKNIVIFSGEKAAEYVGRLATNGEEGFFNVAVDTGKIIDKGTSAIDLMGLADDEIDAVMYYLDNYPKGTLDYMVDFTDQGVELSASAVLQRPEESK